LLSWGGISRNNNNNNNKKTRICICLSHLVTYYYYYYYSLLGRAFTCVFSSEIKRIRVYMIILYYYSKCESSDVLHLASNVTLYNAMHDVSTSFGDIKLLHVPPWYHKPRRGAKRLAESIAYAKWIWVPTSYVVRVWPARKAATWNVIFHTICTIKYVWNITILHIIMILIEPWT